MIKQGTRLLMEVFAWEMGGRKSTPSPVKKHPKEKNRRLTSPPKYFHFKPSQPNLHEAA